MCEVSGLCTQPFFVRIEVSIGPTYRQGDKVSVFLAKSVVLH